MPLKESSKSPPENIEIEVDYEQKTAQCVLFFALYVKNQYKIKNSVCSQNIGRNIIELQDVQYYLQNNKEDFL